MDCSVFTLNFFFRPRRRSDVVLGVVIFVCRFFLQLLQYRTEAYLQMRDQMVTRIIFIYTNGEKRTCCTQHKHNCIVQSVVGNNGALNQPFSTREFTLRNQQHQQQNENEKPRTYARALAHLQTKDRSKKMEMCKAVRTQCDQFE